MLAVGSDEPRRHGQRYRTMEVGGTLVAGNEFGIAALALEAGLALATN